MPRRDASSAKKRCVNRKHSGRLGTFHKFEIPKALTVKPKPLAPTAIAQIGLHMGLDIRSLADTFEESGFYERSIAQFV